MREGGITYADLLKQIKHSVNPSTLGVELSGLRRTQRGDLLLTVKNGAQKAEELQTALTGAGLYVATGRSQIFHIKYMNADATAENVKKAIAEGSEGAVGKWRCDLFARRTVAGKTVRFQFLPKDSGGSP